MSATSFSRLRLVGPCSALTLLVQQRQVLDLLGDGCRGFCWPARWPSPGIALRALFSLALIASAPAVLPVSCVRQIELELRPARRSATSCRSVPPSAGRPVLLAVPRAPCFSSDSMSPESSAIWPLSWPSWACSRPDSAWPRKNWPSTNTSSTKMMMISSVDSASTQPGQMSTVRRARRAKAGRPSVRIRHAVGIAPRCCAHVRSRPRRFLPAV